MAVMKKIAGLIVGASTVAVIGVAIAQGVPPNPFISNPALGAGQQSSHLTAMGDTGVPGMIDQSRVATITTVQEVAVIEEPAVVAVVEEPAQEESTVLGAGPAPMAETPAPMVAKADRG